MPKKSETKKSKEEITELKKDAKSEKISKQKEAKKLAQSDYEKKVIELANSGLTAEKIGQKLMNSGIHPGEYPKKISQILKEKGLYTSPDLKNIEVKLSKITEHYKKNKQDKRAKREKDRVFAQLRKTKEYLEMPLK